MSSTELLFLSHRSIPGRGTALESTFFGLVVGVVFDEFDPMFAEFVAEQEAVQARARSDDWSESMDPDFSDALDAWAGQESDPFGSWFAEWSDPDYVPPGNATDNATGNGMAERNEGSLGAVVGSSGVPNGGANGGAVDDVPQHTQRNEGSLVPCDEVVPVAGSCSDADAESFGAWVSPGRKLSGVTRSSVDEFGDRVDDDGLQARGLRRVPSGDGRSYWWAGAVWLRNIGVDDWVESFRNNSSIEGFAVVHDRDDEVDDHLHFLVRRRGGRRKASERQITQFVDEVFGTRVPSVSSVDDVRSAAAYLVHLNSAGKFHYDVRSVVVSGSVSFSDWVAESQADWLEELWLMQSVIEEQLARGRKVTLQGFLSWVHAERRDWFRLLVQRSAARAYLKDFINGG